MFSNLLSFSLASQQLFAFGACVKRGEGKANTVDRGAKKCAVILFDALSTFIGLFCPPLPQFILFDLKDLHAKFDVICFLQTETHTHTYQQV